MKKILIAVVLFSCIVSGCKKVKRLSYQGVFKLEKQTISGGKKDTTWIREQMKIYTDRNYIYAGIAADSSLRMGIGSYELDSGNRIDEHNIFNNKALDSTQIFVVSITQTNKGFTGNVPDWSHLNGTQYKLTEEYTKVPLAGRSILDGAWNLDKMYHVKGKDTSIQQETKFKVFWGGHYMFIHRYPVNAVGSQYKDGFRYGMFELRNNVLHEKETMGVPFDRADRDLNSKVIINKKEYTQVFIDPETKGQTIEVYKQLVEY